MSVFANAHVCNCAPGVWTTSLGSAGPARKTRRQSTGFTQMPRDHPRFYPFRGSACRMDVDGKTESREKVRQSTFSSAPAPSKAQTQRGEESTLGYIFRRSPDGPIGAYVRRYRLVELPQPSRR